MPGRPSSDPGPNTLDSTDSTDSTDSPKAQSDRNATADRAIDVLLLFDEDRPVLSANAVASELKMSRSTTYRYLQSLRTYGLLEEDDARGAFRLGSRVFQLAKVARTGLGLIEVALPVMRELAESHNCVAILTRRSGNQVVVIERVETSASVRLSYERGHVLPVHAGAAAKIVLAFEDEAHIDGIIRATKLIRFTPETVTDPEQFRADLDKIREDGYSVTDGEVDLGVRAVAAPVLAEDGRVLAGISVAGLSSQLTDDQIPELVAAVCRAGEAISARLLEVEG